MQKLSEDQKQLLLQTAAAIAAQPERFDMSNWAYAENPDENMELAEDSQGLPILLYRAANCRTTACIGGHMLFQKGLHIGAYVDDWDHDDYVFDENMVCLGKVFDVLMTLVPVARLYFDVDWPRPYYDIGRYQSMEAAAIQLLRDLAADKVDLEQTRSGRHV